MQARAVKQLTRQEQGAQNLLVQLCPLQCHKQFIPGEAASAANFCHAVVGFVEAIHPHGW